MGDYGWSLNITILTLDVNLLCAGMVVFTSSRKIMLLCDLHWIWFCSLLVNFDYYIHVNVFVMYCDCMHTFHLSHVCSIYNSVKCVGEGEVSWRMG